MFRATFSPSSGALLNCSRSLWFPYRSQGGCVSCPLTNRLRQETHPPWLLYGNRRLRLQFKSAPDDGQNVARNMLTNRPRQETHPPWLLCGNRRLRLQFKSAPDDGRNVARNMLSSV
jgi:hypothetical protein